jgi:hypothetical protein
MSPKEISLELIDSERALKIKGKQSLVINLAIVKVPTRVKRNDHATPVTFKKAKIKNPSLKE